ncbi:GAF domain-containing SpoIIE family protein phosphatase [Stygiobacter electus]|uniref:SpoIIE family protein phosphatase n=1 Tax=Stygiobacter electus TaxID=3032292 RepID=A0AAE3TD14_9BACT|nr:GAF domain-containing SpoIIE family protein phosphatase [Stygiobacter electus]MDF1610743.1 SpoIIE family protein phosphatase [Stygiobacter electus]
MSSYQNNSALRNFSALVDFSNLINSSLDLNFTLNNILLTCLGKFHTTKGMIALLNEENKFIVKASKGISQKIIDEFPAIFSFNYDIDEKFSEYLTKNNFQVYQEIKSTEGLKGLILLGKKLTNQEYDKEDINFLRTILNVGATAIENSLIVDKLKKINRQLDSKVNQLSSLFDLSKEFSGLLKTEQIAKLLVLSLIGQMLVSKYSIIISENEKSIFLENNFDKEILIKIFSQNDIKKIERPLVNEELAKTFQDLINVGVEIIVPMQLKGETKGLIVLGKRNNHLDYNNSDIEFISSLGSLAIISIENARLFNETLEKQKLEKDLETARNIQKNLLPNKIPTSEIFEIVAFNKSAKMVGGDYYDIIKLNNEKILFAIADVSGKGVPAALLMANIQAFLKSICKMNLPLDESTNLLNDLVAENTSNGSFITFFWGILDEKNKTLTYVNAGHNPPLLIRNKEIIKLKKGGMILGVMQTIVPYQLETIEMKANDLIVLFTDGITEAMNKNWEEFSDERLEKIVTDNNLLSAKNLLIRIQDEINNFTEGAEQSDDITSLIIKVIK